MSIIIAILVFGAIIVVHEFGHFQAARRCNVKVEEFAIGIGPKIFSFKPGETVYSLRVFPIGGFCRMLGEDESNPDARALNNASVWKRMSIILGGVFMNFLLAIIFMVVITFLGGYTTTTVYSVSEDTPAAEIGLKPGDKIIEANGSKINIFDDMYFLLQDTGGKTIDITFLRDGEKIMKQVTPYPVKYSDGSVGYKIGYVPYTKAGLFRELGDGVERVGFFDGLKTAYYTNLYFVKTAVIGIQRLVSGRIGIQEMSGPVGVTTVISDVYEQSVSQGPVVTTVNMLYFLVFLSVNVGVFNLLPLPALDGGRFIFLLLEAIRRKPVKPEIEGVIHFVGLALLMILSVFIMYNDVLKIFNK